MFPAWTAVRNCRWLTSPVGYKTILNEMNDVSDIAGNMLTSLGSLESAKYPHLTEVLSNHNQLESLSPDIADNWLLMKR